MANMICPACGHFQEQADECSKCGIIIAKYKAADDAPVESAVTREPRSGSGNGFPVAPLLLVLAALGGGAWFLLGGTDEPASVTQPETRESVLNPAQQALVDQVKVTQALGKVLKIKGVVLALDEPPSDAAGLGRLVSAGLLTAEDLIDPWGRPIEYSVTQFTGDAALVMPVQVKVYSRGPDGMAGTMDDLVAP